MSSQSAENVKLLVVAGLEQAGNDNLRGRVLRRLERLAAAELLVNTP
jgi:hypothetical protein